MKRPLDQDTESIQYCDIYVLEYLIEIEGLSSSQISEFIMTKNVVLMMKILRMKRNEIVLG